MKTVQVVVMEYQQVAIKMKIKHIELLDSLKQQYGAQSRAKALEMLLDNLLDSGSQTPAEGCGSH